MNKDQFRRNQLQRRIKGIKEKIEVLNAGLNHPEYVSINTCPPWGLSTKMEKEDILVLKRNYEKLLEEANMEFNSLQIRKL